MAIAKNTIAPTIINEKCCRMCIGSCQAAKSIMKGTRQIVKRIIEIMIHIKPNLLRVNIFLSNILQSIINVNLPLLFLKSVSLFLSEKTRNLSTDSAIITEGTPVMKNNECSRTI